MVSSMRKNDHKNMLKFLKACALRDSKLCVKYCTKLAYNYDESNST